MLVKTITPNFATGTEESSIFELCLRHYFQMLTRLQWIFLNIALIVVSFVFTNWRINNLRTSNEVISTKSGSLSAPVISSLIIYNRVRFLILLIFH